MKGSPVRIPRTSEQKTGVQKGANSANLDGGWARFKIDVESGTNPHGKLRFKVHKGLRLKSTEIDQVLVSTGARAAAILGTAQIKGGQSFDFRVDVEDLPGAPDTFRIRLSNGYDSGEQRIHGDLDIECEDDDAREDEDDKGTGNGDDKDDKGKGDKGSQGSKGKY